MDTSCGLETKAISAGVYQGLLWLMTSLYWEASMIILDR